MKKTFLLLVVAILTILSLSLVSCDYNVYRPENDTWSVRNMYFQTFDEALSWLMGQSGGSSRGLTESDIPDNLTITLMRDVTEGGNAIVVPESFSGSLCIDFQGHDYWFKPSLGHFFEFLGGDKIDVINGKTIIPENASSTSKALIVDVINNTMSPFCAVIMTKCSDHPGVLCNLCCARCV